MIHAIMNSDDHEAIRKLKEQGAAATEVHRAGGKAFGIPRAQAIKAANQQAAQQLAIQALTADRLH